MITVDTDEICAGVQDIFEDTRSIVEPAGALAVAAIKKYVAREKCQGKRLVAINCGANLNFDRLRHIAERAEVGAQREALLAVQIPEEPGSFLRFCGVLGRAPSPSSTTAMKPRVRHRCLSASGWRAAAPSATR